MFKDKIFITDKQAFTEWKRKYTPDGGWFYAKCHLEEEPKSYPCILLETEDYNKIWDEYDIFYSFVYLTDFIKNNTNGTKN